MNIHNKQPSSRDFEEAKKDIARLKGLGYRVALRGTEILLNLSYLSLFPLVGQNYLQTNGIVISQQPSILNKIKKNGIENIIITYSFLDEVSSVPVELAKKAINICKNDFSITLSIIITKRFSDNLGLLSEACEKALDLGARAIKFIRLMPINPKHKKITLTEEESALVLREIHNLKQKYCYNELIIQTPGCFGQFNLRRTLNKDKFEKMDLSDVYDCPAGVCHFVIDTMNNVFPCLYLMDKEFVVGICNEGNLRIHQENNKNFWGKLRSEECPAFIYWVSQGERND